MKSFRNIVLASVVSLASIGTAFGQADKAPEYRDVLKQCGAEWKGSGERKAVEKGQGAAKWQEFRAKCVLDKGWKKGTRSKAAVVSKE
jgi:hypothetical protein